MLYCNCYCNKKLLYCTHETNLFAGLWKPLLSRGYLKPWRKTSFAISRLGHLQDFTSQSWLSETESPRWRKKKRKKEKIKNTTAPTIPLLWLGVRYYLGCAHMAKRHTVYGSYFADHFALRLFSTFWVAIGLLWNMAWTLCPNLTQSFFLRVEW